MRLISRHDPTAETQNAQNQTAIDKQEKHTVCLVQLDTLVSPSGSKSFHPFCHCRRYTIHQRTRQPLGMNPALPIEIHSPNGRRPHGNGIRVPIGPSPANGIIPRSTKSRALSSLVWCEPSTKSHQRPLSRPNTKRFDSYSVTV